MIQAPLAALFSGSQRLCTRYLIRRYAFSNGRLIALVFTGYFIFLAPFAPAYFDHEPGMFTTTNIILLFALAASSISANMLLLQGTRHTDAEKSEPLFLTYGIFTIILAFLLYADERNAVNAVLAVIATFAVVSINIEKHHFQLNRYSLLILVAAGLWAVHISIMKQLLTSFSPFMVLLLNSMLVSSVTVLAFGVHRKDISGRKLPLIIFDVMLGIAAWLLQLWSYQLYGLVTTTLFLALAPIVTEWGSKLFLKEALHWKNLAATVVIAGCISASFIV